MVNNSLICLFVKFYFNIISPVKFDKQLVLNHEDLHPLTERHQVEILSLNYNNKRDIDEAKKIILIACGGKEKFYVESVKCVASLLKDESLDMLEASRILAEIADSEAINISIQFVGFYSEFIRLGMNKDYIVRFNKLLENTLNELQPI